MADKRAIGTTISVRELFIERRYAVNSYNQPTKYRKVSKLFNMLALSRMDVGFRLFHNDSAKPKLTTPLKLIVSKSLKG